MLPLRQAREGSHDRLITLVQSLLFLLKVTLVIYRRMYLLNVLWAIIGQYSRYTGREYLDVLISRNHEGKPITFHKKITSALSRNVPEIDICFDGNGGGNLSIGLREIVDFTRMEYCIAPSAEIRDRLSEGYFTQSLNAFLGANGKLPGSVDEEILRLLADGQEMIDYAKITA